MPPETPGAEGRVLGLAGRRSYALDFRWGRELRRLTRNILVIDDLADE